MFLYHLPHSAGAVKSLKEVIVSLVLQHLPVKVSLHEFRQPSNMCIGGITNVAKGSIDLEHEIRLVLEGELLSYDLRGFL